MNMDGLRGLRSDTNGGGRRLMSKKRSYRHPHPKQNATKELLLSLLQRLNPLAVSLLGHEKE